mgnify:CR=1 FL=1
MQDLKKVYQALTLEEAELAFEQFKESWGSKYPIIIRSWEKNWTKLMAYFKYPYEIRKLIYTTNTIEDYHRQLRKVTKTKNAYPTDEALLNNILCNNGYIKEMDQAGKELEKVHLPTCHILW